MTTADLTVIIPTYNGLTRGYVHEAVASVLAQTLPPKRLIVIDDGSKDQTAADLQAKFPQIEIHSKPNQGLPATRNFGIRMVDTAYVAFLDDDDVWEPEKTRIQMDYLARHPELDLVFCGVTYIDGKGQVLGHRRPAGFGHGYPEILLGNSLLPPSTVIFKRDLLLRAGPFDETLRQGEDYEYFIRCARHGKIGYVEDLLVRYRQHGQQMSGSLNYIDQATYDIIQKHAASAVPECADDILRYYKYGAALRGAARFDFRHFWESLRTAPGSFDLPMLAMRLVGILLSPLKPAKDRWRGVEHRYALRRHRGASIRKESPGQQLP